MTEIGRMIRDEGIKEGIKEGEKIKELPEETLDVIATDIFDIEKVEDIEKYFG